jgi:hypothetical protein
MGVGASLSLPPIGKNAQANERKAMNKMVKIDLTNAIFKSQKWS